MKDPLQSTSEKLWNEDIKPDSYDGSGKYHDHILEQYKLCVEMADRISARRNLANTFFLTLHTFIIGSAGFLYEKGPLLGVKWIIIFPLTALLALCYSWWRLVKSYRQLNTAKYRVIGAFEKRLPASPYWSAEWNELGEGKDPQKYVPLTHVENGVPIIFALLYIMGALFVILYQ